jgi:integrase/recombinase XerD
MPGRDAREGERELQAYIEWLTVARGCSPNTVAAYGSDIRHFWEFVQNQHAGMPWKAVTEAQVQAWLSAMAREKLKARTAARRLTALRRFFTFLVERGWQSDNPTVLVDMPKLPQTLPKALTEAEVGRLLEAPLGDSPSEVRLRLMLQLLYASGVRVSELCALTLADVEEGEGIVLRVTGKGSKTRLVPLGEVAAATLGTFLRDARSRLRGSHGAYVFAGPTGRALTRQRVFQLVKEAGVRVGVKVAPHHLRHTFATHLVAHDADLRSVQVMLGHASLNTTQIYTKVAQERLKDTLEKFHPLNATRRKILTK